MSHFLTVPARLVRAGPGAWLRVLADVVLVNATYFLAFVFRFLAVMLWTREFPPDKLAEGFRAYMDTYAATAWLLTLISVGIFGLTGLYGGRQHRGQMKFLAIAQAVSLAYLVFGFVMLFLGPYASKTSVKLVSLFPRAVLPLAWLMTLSATAAARFGARLWIGVATREARQLRLQEDSVVQRMLVIGGAGYVGSILCRQLLSSGYRVRVLDALLYGDKAIAELVGSRFELVKGDFRDVDAVVRAMLDVDAVVHLGGLVGDPACELDERLTTEINLAATRMVAEAARGMGVRRFIFASSCSVYGASDDLLSEQSALNPVSLYARTKIESEQILLAMNGPDFSPVILRFATLYGISWRPRFDLVINLFAARATVDRKITVFGGNQWRPFVHVADAAQAIVLCLERPLGLLRGEVFNVGFDEQNLTITQAAELVVRQIPGATLINSGENVDRRNYRVSFGKARDVLGLKPRRTLESGVQEIRDALLSGRIRNYQEQQFSNYLSLRDDHAGLAPRAGRISTLYEIR